MRPAILNPLFKSVGTLPGVGPKVAALIGKLLGAAEGAEPRVVDLLFHIPAGAIDRRRQPGIARAAEGAVVTVTARVDRHQPAPRHARVPYRVFVHDETGELALVFFHANRAWLEKTLPVGGMVVISGAVEWFNGRPQMVHPDYIVPVGDAETMPAVEPVYPLTAGLSRKTLQKAIGAALEGLADLPEWGLPERLTAFGWPGFSEALRSLHRPTRPEDIAAESAAVRRLAYDELLASQLALALTRVERRRAAGLSRQGDGRIAGRILAALPFQLTGSQERALADIRADLARPEKMLRLLQGDVGSGKTIVSLLAMATAVEAGGQAALMARPILARQHAETIAPLAEAAGLRRAVLTGRERGRERETVLAGLAGGDLTGAGIDILIGTHALLEEPVRFRDLALVVVDEQHRFGVHQRLALTEKGRAVDLLVMTATPIPRTLVLAYFGDMEVSQLTEKPAGRKPVDTRVTSLERLDEVVSRIGAAVAAGGKVFWVCPLVEESADSDLTAATERAETLRGALRVPVGLVHGRMSGGDKDRAMETFRSGGTSILVATTVIEVGVDVPDATIMVIEHAERFGLAQLHQLRGRIGRGAATATCLLLYRPPLGEIARARLEIMRETDDGFRIAEEDLRLRGEGDLLGTRQSGMAGFRIARIDAHRDLMEVAREDARAAVEAMATDPARREALRMLLYLFDRDGAIRLLDAG